MSRTRRRGPSRSSSTATSVLRRGRTSPAPPAGATTASPRRGSTTWSSRWCRRASRSDRTDRRSRCRRSCATRSRLSRTRPDGPLRRLSGAVLALAAGLSLGASDGAGVHQLQKLTGAGEQGIGEFGSSVALSAKGKTLLIGGTNDHSLIGALETLQVRSQAIGAAWVFSRSAATWEQQGGKLLGKGERGPGEFGHSVALSADGNTALIGGPSGYGGIGAAWALSRSRSGWTQAKLTPTGISQASGYVSNPTGFGAGVAISANGRT